MVVRAPLPWALLLFAALLAGSACTKANADGPAAPPASSDGGATDALRARLTPLQFEVTQRNGTEPPFQNPYWDHKAPGIYVDVVSGEALFSSLDKFDSGTGWPSFTRPLEPGNVVEKVDGSHGMARTEVRSKLGGSHLGHVFDDGPAPTRLRYCINSAALRFVPAEDLDREGYGQFSPLFARAQKALTATALFAGGCFWCMEGPFEKLEGVSSVVSGYTGGKEKDPTYEEVSRGGTGHAEAVQVTYDPAKISYQRLLETFWRNVDPFAKDRQFCDRGRQYRSGIFVKDAAERAAAEASKRALEKKFGKRIETEVTEAGAFYPAEAYHQDYYRKNPLRYQSYRMGCGRDRRLEEIWGQAPR